jgi:hypothetical protein
MSADLSGRAGVPLALKGDRRPHGGRWRAGSPAAAAGYYGGAGRAAPGRLLSGAQVARGTRLAAASETPLQRFVAGC